MVKGVVVASQESLGRRIRRLREELPPPAGKRSVTQEELATRVGVARTAVAAWETDKREPELENAQRLAEVLGVTVGELFREVRRPAARSATADGGGAPGRFAAESLRLAQQGDAMRPEYARAAGMTDGLGYLVLEGKLSLADAISSANAIAEQRGYSEPERNFIREWEAAIRDALHNRHRHPGADSPGPSGRGGKPDR